MAKLKQSAAEWCYFRDGCNVAELYAGLKRAGYGALEMVNEARWPAVKEAGLKVLNMGAPGMKDGISRIENHGTLLPQIRTQIAKAQANQLEQIIVFSGSRNGMSDAEGIANCAKALKELSGQAESAGVVLLLEVLNAYDHVDYQCDSGRFAFEVMDVVNSPSVKVLYDIYHAHRMGEDVAKVIAANVRYIGHMHTAGSPKRDFPGDAQAIDYRAVVKAALAAGYKGYWGHEFRCEGNPLEEFSRACALFDSYA